MLDEELQLKESRKKSMKIFQECNTLINNINVLVVEIWNRDKIFRKRLKELLVGLNLDMTDLIIDVQRILSLNDVQFKEEFMKK